jgi:hypothetical protein
MIRLLDGNEYDKQELLKKMDDDSFYYGELGRLALSSSSAKKLLESPNSYRKSFYQSDDSQPLRDGRLFHLSVLEPHKMNDLIVIEGTKAKKEFKDATSEHGSSMVYTASEVKTANMLGEVLLSNSKVNEYLLGSEPEVPAIGEIHGMPFRGKADALFTCPLTDEVTVIDLKTTSSPVDDFPYSARKFSYDLQAYIYTMLFGATEFMFIVINKTNSDIGIYHCSQDFIAQGEQKLIRAIEVYNQFFSGEASEEKLKEYYVTGIL